MKKVVAWILCITFLWTDSLWGITGTAIQVRPVGETPSYLQIDIPEELATIEEVYEAPAKIDPRLVLHVQTAHGNYDAQVQIKKLLAYLHDSYDFDLMFVEGAAEELDPKYASFFADHEKNIKMADDLAREGRMTGPELFLMEAQDAVRAVGIERADLYKENFVAFRTVHESRADVDNFLTQFEAKLDMLSSRYFNSDTRKLLLEWKKFQVGQRDFIPYVKRLSKAAKRILGLDLDSLFAQVEWPQLTRLLVMQSMEADLNRDDAMKEREKLILFLRENRVSESVIQGISNLEDNKIQMNRLKPGQEREALLPRHLLERLVDEAGKKGFRFQDFPAFSLYAGYLILESELDSRTLFEEIELLFKKLLDELTATEGEKDLLELFRDEQLFKKLLHLEVTRKEWDRVDYRRDWVNPGSMINRLTSVRERLTEGGFGETTLPQASEGLSVKDSVVIAFESAFKFYQVAKDRESVFFEKIKSEMQVSGSEKAVLISGGFHTDGLLDLFREDEMSYGVLTPRIRKIDGHDNYVKTMLETHPTVFDLAQMEIRAYMQSPQAKLEMGARLPELVKGMVNDMLSRIEEPSESNVSEALEYFNSLDVGVQLQYQNQRVLVWYYDGNEDDYVPVKVDGIPQVIGISESEGVFKANSYVESGGDLYKQENAPKKQSREEVRDISFNSDLKDAEGRTFEQQVLAEDMTLIRRIISDARNPESLVNMIDDPLLEGRVYIADNEERNRREVINQAGDAIEVGLTAALAGDDFNGRTVYYRLKNRLNSE